MGEKEKENRKRNLESPDNMESGMKMGFLFLLLLFYSRVSHLISPSPPFFLFFSFFFPTFSFVLLYFILFFFILLFCEKL